MSIPEEVWNGAWHGNWQDDEETIHGILEKPPVDARHRRQNGRASEIRSPLQSARVTNTTGFRNTAVGVQALGNLVSGFDNIAIWLNAGFSLNSGEARNIDIDHSGVAGENATIRIGTLQTRTLIAGIHGVSEGGMGILPVYINSEGQLGTSASSRRFKKEIQPMDTGSEVILQLKPVTFQYRNDNTGTPQFGLIAEEVAEVNPDLVVRDKDGEIYTVRYEAVNAMLLNELLKEHRTVNELRATVAQRQKQLEALTAGLQKGLRNST